MANAAKQAAAPYGSGQGGTHPAPPQRAAAADVGLAPSWQGVSNSGQLCLFPFLHFTYFTRELIRQ